MTTWRVLLILPLLLIVSGCGVVHTSEGETSYYRFDATSWLMIGGGGLAIAAVGWFVQRSDDSDTGSGKAKGWGAMIIGILFAICGVPAIATSRVTVTNTSTTLDDRFIWPFPSPKEIVYADLSAVEEIQEERRTRRGKRTTHYMVVTKHDGSTEKFEMGRLTREAFPEIIRRLEAMDSASGANPAAVAFADSFGSGNSSQSADGHGAAPAIPHSAPAIDPAQQAGQQPFSANVVPAQPRPVAESPSPGVAIQQGDRRGIDPDVNLEKGTKLEAEYGGRWLPVTVIEGGVGSDPKIHWDGWQDTWDQVMARSAMRWPPGGGPPAEVSQQADNAPRSSPFRNKPGATASNAQKSQDSPSETPDSAGSAEPADEGESPEAGQKPGDTVSDDKAESESPFRKKPSSASTDNAEKRPEATVEGGSPFRPKGENVTDESENESDAAASSPFRKKETAEKPARNASPFKSKKSSEPPKVEAPAVADADEGIDPARLINAKTRLSKGQKVEGSWGSTWEPATILELQSNGMVKVHWDGRPAAYDKFVPRSKLRFPEKTEDKK